MASATFRQRFMGNRARPIGRSTVLELFKGNVRDREGIVMIGIASVLMVGKYNSVYKRLRACLCHHTREHFAVYDRTQHHLSNPDLRRSPDGKSRPIFEEASALIAKYHSVDDRVTFYFCHHTWQRFTVHGRVPHHLSQHSLRSNPDRGEKTISEEACRDVF